MLDLRLNINNLRLFTFYLIDSLFQRFKSFFLFLLKCSLPFVCTSLCSLNLGHVDTYIWCLSFFMVINLLNNHLIKDFTTTFSHQLTFVLSQIYGWAKVIDETVDICAYSVDILMKIVSVSLDIVDLFNYGIKFLSVLSLPFVDSDNSVLYLLVLFLSKLVLHFDFGYYTTHVYVSFHENLFYIDDLLLHVSYRRLLRALLFFATC